MTDEPANSELERASRLYQSGRQMMDANELIAAEKAFDESAKLSPHFKTLELLGECRLLMGRLKDSIVPLAAASALIGAHELRHCSRRFCSLWGNPETHAFMRRWRMNRSPQYRQAMAVMAAIQSALSAKDLEDDE